MKRELTAEHTHAPWTIGKRIGSMLVIHADDGCTNVAAAFGSELTNSIRHPMNQTQEANARLMAASPDLLAACKLVVRGLELSPVAGMETDLEILRAAIARAEGMEVAA